LHIHSYPLHISLHTSLHTSLHASPLRHDSEAASHDHDDHVRRCVARSPITHHIDSVDRREIIAAQSVCARHKYPFFAY
ncbi:MAG: hypothetical protein VX964_05355, partial [Verrucomicrobiota bacterium]|nr:hypothetical protein [Verrucomicrobiota bacterium]